MSRSPPSHPEVSSSSAAETKVGKRDFEGMLDRHKTYFKFRPKSPIYKTYAPGHTITVHGFLGKRRQPSKNLVFADVIQTNPTSAPVSLMSHQESGDGSTHALLKTLTPYSAVSVTGTIAKDKTAEDDSRVKAPKGLLIELTSIQVLSPFPKDIIVSDGVVFPPTARHLQMRFDEALRRRLHFRAFTARLVDRILSSRGLLQTETPLLFKSTPEGAREFVVPTRRRGFAYALPQSPQQFKQIMMAAGFHGYFQIARCFRDEDLRADRQPEFTQLDLELSFATGDNVMRLIEHVLLKKLFSAIARSWCLTPIGGTLVPISKGWRRNTKNDVPFPVVDFQQDFPRMSYEEAMASYGSDKPDLRIPNVIQRIGHVLPQDFVGKITHLDDPVVEACMFRLQGSPRENWQFVTKFCDNMPVSMAKNPDGAPAVMQYDSSKPLCGFSALGHAGFSAITGETAEFKGLSPFEDGDILIVQARPNKPFEGGSTALGALRTALYHEAIKAELLPVDSTLRFLWITGFPLFTPNDGAEPGQGGSSGFSSTHHPFTAPFGPEDFDLLLTDPLKAKADHYDLVLNGVEVGGGSRRIHVAEVQEFVMRDILKMSDDGIGQFSHLLEALRAGCPPHAGFAFGFDRLVAVLSNTNSIRDVVAFPKSMKGEDLSVKSPGRMTEEQLDTYHLALRNRHGENKS